MTKISPRSLLTVALTAVVLTSASTTAAYAQTFPAKPLRFVVPFPAGSATDAVGRVVGQAMSEALGQSITVENKAGAQGTIGAKDVKDAAGDGYTLLVTTSTTQAAVTSLLKSVPYDPVKDFTPIGKIGTTPFVLITQQSFPANDLQGLIANAKANPGKLAFGQGSSGSWVSGSLFSSMAGADILMVPYKGIPPAITDLLGGNLQIVFADLGNGMAQLKGGKVKAFGVTSPKRASQIPDVPAISEVLPGYDLVAWFALMAPANVPKEVAAKLTATLQAVLQKPEVKQKLSNAGIDIDSTDAAGLAKLIESESKRWAMMTKQAKIEKE
jgi:tripartite-type tricarboxylate transporter receptor subunit TctC